MTDIGKRVTSPDGARGTRRHRGTPLTYLDPTARCPIAKDSDSPQALGLPSHKRFAFSTPPKSAEQPMHKRMPAKPHESIHGSTIAE